MRHETMERLRRKWPRLRNGLSVAWCRWHTYWPLLTKTEPMRGETGQICRWFGVSVDVSDLQEKERQLIEAHGQLELVLDSGAICGTWVGIFKRAAFEVTLALPRHFPLTQTCCMQACPCLRLSGRRMIFDRLRATPTCRWQPLQGSLTQPPLYTPFRRPKLPMGR